MSIRLNGNTANYLSRSTGLLNFNSTYSWRVRVYIVNLPSAGNNQNIFTISSEADSLYDTISIDSGGVLSLTCSVTGWAETAVTGSTLSTVTWYDLVMERETTTSLKLFVNGVLDITNARDVSARGAATNMYLGVWSAATAGRASPFDGRLAVLQEYSIALAVNDALATKDIYLPKFNVNAWHPTFNGATERARDYSGNGYNWTESGTISDEDQPPIAWGGSVDAIWTPESAVATGQPTMRRGMNIPGMRIGW